MDNVKDHDGNLPDPNRQNNTYVLRSSTLHYDDADFFAKGGEGRAGGTRRGATPFVANVTRARVREGDMRGAERKEGRLIALAFHARK